MKETEFIYKGNKFPFSENESGWDYNFQTALIEVESDGRKELFFAVIV